MRIRGSNGRTIVEWDYGELARRIIRPGFGNKHPDPQVVGPGVREPPPGGMNEPAGRAVLSHMRKLHAGSRPPEVDGITATAARVFAIRCASCHSIDREGDATDGGDLSRVGREHTAEWLRAWIADPTAIDPTVEMPAFGTRLSEPEMTALVAYLARRQ